MTEDQRARWIAHCQGEVIHMHNLLPTLCFGGWEGEPSGWLPYFPNWRTQPQQNMHIALMEFAAARNKNQRLLIKTDIINAYYGGEEAFIARLNKLRTT